MFGYRLQDIIGTEKLPMSRPTVRRLIKSGKLEASRIGGTIYINPRSLETLAERLRITPLEA